MTRFLAVLTCVVMLALAGCSSRAEKATGPSSSTAAVSVARTGTDNGPNAPRTAIQDIGTDSSRYQQGADPVYDSSVPGIELSDALSRIGRPVPLPQMEDKVEKVVYFPAPDSSGYFEMAILYSSGYKLYVRPGAHNLEALNEELKPVKFRDGANHIQPQSVGAREVLIVAGGTQAGPGEGHRVKPVVLFNDAGFMYDVYATPGDANAVGRLRQIVASVR